MRALGYLILLLIGSQALARPQQCKDLSSLHLPSGLTGTIEMQKRGFLERGDESYVFFRDDLLFCAARPIRVDSEHSRNVEKRSLKVSVTADPWEKGSIRFHVIGDHTLQEINCSAWDHEGHLAQLRDLTLQQFEEHSRSWFKSNLAELIAQNKCELPISSQEVAPALVNGSVEKAS